MVEMLIHIVYHSIHSIPYLYQSLNHLSLISYITITARGATIYTYIYLFIVSLNDDAPSHTTQVLRQSSASSHPNALSLVLVLLSSLLLSHSEDSLVASGDALRAHLTCES